MPIITCQKCGGEKHMRPSFIKKGGGKYCSRKCYWEAKKGEKHSPEMIEKFRQTVKARGSLKNEKNAMWKGDGVGYFALHKWVRRNFEKPDSCEFCGAVRYTEWANSSGKYLRDREDWHNLCVPCHRVLDKTRNIVADWT